jgi:hypothetical protein
MWLKSWYQLQWDAKLIRKIIIKQSTQTWQRACSSCRTYIQSMQCTIPSLMSHAIHTQRLVKNVVEIMVPTSMNWKANSKNYNQNWPLCSEVVDQIQNLPTSMKCKAKSKYYNQNWPLYRTGMWGRHNRGDPQPARVSIPSAGAGAGLPASYGLLGLGGAADTVLSPTGGFPFPILGFFCVFFGMVRRQRHLEVR